MSDDQTRIEYQTRWLESILGDSIGLKVAEPWMWETRLCEQEEALIARSVAKRQREFRAGRHSAHQLLAEQKASCEALLTGKQREPAWPDGWVGSISHTQGICVAVVAPTSGYSSIGIDVEQATELPAEIINAVCRPEELDQLSVLRLRDPSAQSLPLEKIIFSAKESIHKTYFPLNYHTLDFLDARIELDLQQQTFHAHVIKPEANPNHPISYLKGRFSVSTEFVATFISLPVS